MDINTRVTTLKYICDDVASYLVSLHYLRVKFICKHDTSLFWLGSDSPVFSFHSISPFQFITLLWYPHLLSCLRPYTFTHAALLECLSCLPTALSISFKMDFYHFLSFPGATHCYLLCALTVVYSLQQMILFSLLFPCISTLISI